MVDQMSQAMSQATRANQSEGTLDRFELLQMRGRLGEQQTAKSRRLVK